MNGKYGKNQWKILLVQIVGAVVAVAVVIGIGVGIYKYAGPKYTAFQEARKEKAELERKEAEEAARLEAEEMARLEEEQRLAAEAEAQQTKTADDQAREDIDEEDTEAAEKKADKKKSKKKKEQDKYIIADSNIRYLSNSDVENLSLKKINYAKNEIYARRGRRFLSTELQQYFDSKSWYSGTIAPEDFDESVFNEYEKTNARFLSDVEHAIDANGYRPD